jgi:nickel transport protein
VNVFAFVDGDEIQVECGFTKTRKVVNGRIVVADSETGDTVLEGTTDREGVFRFRPPEAFLATGHGLTIQLYAGEGHKNEWNVTPEELRALSKTPAGKTPAPVAPTAKPASVGGSGDGDRAVSPLDITQLETIIGKVIDAKLTPVKQALAEQQNAEPGLRDIVGGIGWILGLLGLATYMKYRR